jgi:hypothetical protein
MRGAIDVRHRHAFQQVPEMHSKAIHGVSDTSVWIEWLTGSALGKKLGTELPNKSLCIVPTIVQRELSKWLVREVGEE